MPAARSPLLRRTALFVFLLAFTASLQAQQTASCANALGSAESSYQESNYDETIRLLTPCTGQLQADPARTIGLYRLLSMAYMNSGNAEGARKAILDLLRAMPGYEPDPIQDPPSYTVLVLIVRDQLAQQSGTTGAGPPDRPASWTKRRGTWLALGGGLIVIGLAAILTGGGGTSN